MDRKHPIPTAPFVLLHHNQQQVEAASREGDYDALSPSGRNSFDEIVAFLVSTG
ncbi:MAG: hypothetical protein HY321_11910, partial [Armatimonadetes bacterium]|nr:hypothetical protein [Armatimonadota bacterium]